MTTRFSVPFGSGGPARIQHLLRVLTHEKFKDFDAPDFKERLRQNDEARVDRGDKLVRRIQEGVHRHVVETLKAVYNNDPNFIELAIDNQDLLTSTYKKRLDDRQENRRELATYLDFLDLKKIIGVEKNWPNFKEKLDFVIPGEKNQSKNLAWFETINKTRRVPAHPYDRSYSDEDMKALEAVHGMLCDRKLISEDE